MTHSEVSGSSPDDPDRGAAAVLADAHEWADDHRELLELVATEFEAENTWPEVGPLQRTLAKRGSDVDVWRAVSRMPRLLGWTVPNNRVQLTVAGLAHTEAGRRTASDAARVVCLAVERFFGEGEPPVVRSGDMEGLGLSGPHLEKVRTVILEEPGIWAGGTGPNEDGQWDRAVNDQVRHLRDVSTLDDYVRVEARDYAPSTWAPFAVPGSESTLPPSARDDPFLTANDLEPRIAAVCASRFQSGHFRDGVREAVIALRDVIREAAGLPQLKDEDLVNRALGGKAPVLRVASADDPSADDIQRGTHLIASGIQAAFRNPLMHEAIDMDPVEALEMVAAISWVARRVSDSHREASA